MPKCTVRSTPIQWGKYRHFSATRRLWCFGLLPAFLFWCGHGVGKDDKSGVSPNTISLPKGPGSVEGLGEAFQPSLNTGTAKYSISLKVPPGVAGHDLELRLNYEGGAGNGPLGFGWQLPRPFIQRQTDKGIPTYGTNFGFERLDHFINEMKEELVPRQDGYWFSKNENAFVRYRAIADYWEGTRPDGTRLQFGVSPSNRIQDAVTDRIFRWELEREIDTHGNTIVYAYTNFSGDQNVNQTYLAEIRYGAGASPWINFHFICFHYEDRPDWFEDCRPGFVVRTGKRLRSIVIGTQGPILTGHLQGDFNGDGVRDNLVRRYELDYLAYAGAQSHWSLLAKVTLVGADGSSTLPPLTFGYSICNPPDEFSAAGLEIGAENEPRWVMDRSFVDFVDLNGDGLPDLLQTDGSHHIGFTNQGPFFSQGQSVIRWSPPTEVASFSGDAWNFDLSSANTHLADMDGDGLADLVHKAAFDTVFYFRNRGRLAWTEREPMSVGTMPPPAPFGELDVRTADVDFDKRTDLIRGNGLEYYVWFNIGSNCYSDCITVPQETVFDFRIEAVQVADLNGDRLADVARIWPTGVDVSAGLGYGHFTGLRRMTLPDFYLSEDEVGKARLSDITGDGLADLVLERVSDGSFCFWINMGNYTFSNRKRVWGIAPGVSLDATIRWADLNGNGSTDVIYADSDWMPRIQAVDIGEILNGGVAPNLLTAISNGIGRVTIIGYEPSTKFALQDAEAGHPWPDPMPFPVQVVAVVTNLDSLGHQYLTQFRYHDGYYDPVEKQFRGFARVEQVDLGDATAPTLVTRSHFDTGRDFEVMKGKLLRLTTEQEEEDGRVFTDDTTAWTMPPVTLYTGTNDMAVHYVHPLGRTNIVKELGQGTERRLESEMNFDHYGNQTLEADYGIVVDGNRSAFDDERISTIEYALNIENWIVRFPMRSEVKDEKGGVISRIDSFYDDETFSGNNWGMVTNGNLTMKYEWISPSNSPAYIRSARTKYDHYGNPVTVLDPIAVAPGGAIDFTKGHTREIAYEPRFHTYPVAETIHLGDGKEPLIFQATYDEGLGTVATSTEFNGNTTAYGYDIFARLTSIVKPGDSIDYPTVEYEYALDVRFPLPGENQGEGVVNFIENRQRDKSEIQNPKSKMYWISREFVDGLGRELMTKTEAESAFGNSLPRVVVTEAAQFNARQKPVRILNPFFSLQGSTLDDLLAFENLEAPDWKGQFHNEGSLITLDLAAAHAIRTDYDATLRELRIENPDGTYRTNRYEPLLTKSYDENDTDPSSPYRDTPMAHYNDGLGRLVQVDEIVRLTDEGQSGPLTNWTTHYEYDLNDQLTRIIDSQNNLKTFTYDGLKRKTFMNDPDRGVMHFVYDEASNLIETTDAKNQRITYTYDGANRILTEKYHDSLLPPPWRSSRGDEALANSVVYHYDDPFPNLPQGNNTIATARNVKGALAWVEDLSGEEHTSYDTRGRVEWTVKCIPDPQFISDIQYRALDLVSYKTTFEYDSIDRMVQLTYPDGDQLRYEYNDRNLLERIPGGPSGYIISNIVYRPSGQNGQIDYGNGVRTTYAYDSRLRLKNLLTVSQPSAINHQLINFWYDFDGVSNIKSIEDCRPGSVVPEGDPRRNTQIFRYDDLYRLTYVHYSFNLPNQPERNDGEINYRYDRIGNMLAKTSDIEHFEKGFSVTDLGEMDSGGSLGSRNRKGRTADDPPGPHALTVIRHSPLPTRHFPYDANGNMLNIDGLECTWDFKDRLIGVENDEMRAVYTYDYTDRRILKRVWPKASKNSPSATIYVNKWFEVREHDAPTKYVWNGNTRIARVTGSLNTNIRVQRLRVFPGWNFCSIAVTAANALEQLNSAFSLQPSAFRWEPTTQSWIEVTPHDTLPAGTILWLRASTNFTLTVTGIYSDPTNQTVSAGGDFLPSAGLEAWYWTNSAFSLQPSDFSLWHYDTGASRWLASLPPPLRLSSDLPSFIAPGEAVFVRASASAQLEVPDSALRIRYYHQDHLGSTGSLSDSSGTLFHESAYYPFGHLRIVSDTPLKDTFMFTQKEYDYESGMQYVEARYCKRESGRFTGPDPQLWVPPGDRMKNPQALNAYAYGLNDPLNTVDIDGAQPRNVFQRVIDAAETVIADTEPLYAEEGNKGTKLYATYKSSNKSKTRTRTTFEKTDCTSFLYNTLFRAGLLGDAEIANKDWKKVIQSTPREAFKKLTDKGIIKPWKKGTWKPGSILFMSKPKSSKGHVAIVKYADEKGVILMHGTQNMSPEYPKGGAREQFLKWDQFERIYGSQSKKKYTEVYVGEPVE